MNTKGITTLMVVSLVLVFFFAAGIIAYTFYFGPPIGEQECGLGVNWKIMVIENKEDICYDSKSKEIRFTLENGLATAIQGVFVKVTSAEDEKTVLLEEARTGRAGAVVGDVPFDQDTEGKLEQIQILPVAVVDDEEVACSDETLEKRQLEPCAFYFY